MSKQIRLKKGLNIHFSGEANKVYSPNQSINKYVIKPTDFHSLTPKLVVKKGDKVKAGSVLFYNKYNDKIKFCSPVSGEILEITRGKKRRILEISIHADDNLMYEEHQISVNKDLSKQEITEHMLKGGVWPFIRQKPYDIIADPIDIPKSVPLSPWNHIV